MAKIVIENKIDNFNKVIYVDGDKSLSIRSLLKKLNICLQISRRSKVPRKKMKNFNIYIFGKPPLSFEPSFKLYDLVK